MSLWDFGKMKDSILMKGWSIPHHKEDGLRAFPVRNIILGYIEHNEVDYRYITTCQEKSSHLEMCARKDYSASRNLSHCSPAKEWGDHCLSTIHTILLSFLQCQSGNRFGLGRKVDGSWAVSLSFQGIFDGFKQSADPATAPNISHPSAAGTRYSSWCGHFFPGHLTGNTKQIKNISKKGK